MRHKNTMKVLRERILQLEAMREAVGKLYEEYSEEYSGEDRILDTSLRSEIQRIRSGVYYYSGVTDSSNALLTSLKVQLEELDKHLCNIADKRCLGKHGDHVLVADLTRGVQRCRLMRVARTTPGGVILEVTTQRAFIFFENTLESAFNEVVSLGPDFNRISEFYQHFLTHKAATPDESPTWSTIQEAQTAISDWEMENLFEKE